MTFPQKLYYIGRDTINRRSGLEVIAGVLTIAIATAITTLSLAFSTTALGLIEGTIEPTRPVAGCIQLGSSGVFTTKDLERIDALIASINKDGKVVDGRTQIATAIEGRELPLLDHAGKELGKNAGIWCMASDAPLLRSDLGFPLVYGSTFASSTDPRIGVLVNLSFLKSYLGYTDAQCAEAVKHPERLPTKLRLQFPPISRLVGSDNDFFTPGPSELTISGFFNERTYPDLIVTLDYAAIYFYDAALTKDGEPQGNFGTAKAFNLKDLVDGTPLLPAADRPPSALPLTIGRDELLTFPSLKQRGLSPFGLMVLSVVDWKTEGARDRIRQRLDFREPVEFNPSPSDVAKLKAAITDSDLRAIAKLIPPAGFSQRLELRRLRVDDPGTAVERYRIHDTETQTDHLIELEGDSARLHAIPSWESALPGKKLADSLIRVRKIILTYRQVIQMIVGLLAACAVYLLAVAHVLRKTRDIGMLLSHGAKRSTIFSIYLGQVMWIGLLGCALGLLLARLAAPGLEAQAADVIRSFSDEVKLLGESTSTRVLAITPWVVVNAALLISLTTVIGALFPAAKAAFTDPLRSIGSGS